MRSFRPLLVLTLVTAMVACSSSRKGGYYENDGPPDKKVDLSGIPDAVPRAEPLSKTGNKPYDVFGKHYVPISSAEGFHQKGVASWYGKQFHGRRTSSGEPYDMYAMTAAHTVLPLPSYVRVTNVANGRSVVVKVNDRGPFKSSRIMDLSYAAAWRLDMINNGTALVEIVAIGENAPRKQVAVEPSLPQTPGLLLYVQIGAFSNPGSARQLRQQLLDDGYRDVGVTEINRGSLRLHRVRLGPLESSQQGEILLDMLRDAGHKEAKMVTD